MKSEEEEKTNKIEEKEEKEKEKEKEKGIKKEDCYFEIIKTPEWDKVIPHIDSIDKHNSNNIYHSIEYPYYRIQNAVQYLPKLDLSSDILNTNQLKELHSNLPSYHQNSNLYKIFTISV